MHSRWRAGRVRLSRARLLQRPTDHSLAHFFGCRHFPFFVCTMTMTKTMMSDGRLLVQVGGQSLPPLTFSLKSHVVTSASRRPKRSPLQTTLTNVPSPPLPLMPTSGASHNKRKTPTNTSLSSSLTKSSSKKTKQSMKKSVRFDKVQIQQYPRTIGDVDDDDAPLAYALALDWLTTDCPSSMHDLDVYERKRNKLHKTLRDYDDIGRLNVAQRCLLLAETMEENQLVQVVVKHRYGATTTQRNVQRVQQELQTFVRQVKSLGDCLQDETYLTPPPLFKTM